RRRRGMNCHRVELLLSNYLEGRLSRRRRNAVAGHLHGCPECRRLRDEITAIGAELRSAALPPAPTGLPQHVMELWDRECALAGSRRRRGSLGLPACSESPAAAWRWAPGLPVVAVALLMLFCLALARWQSDRSALPHLPRLAWHPRDVTLAPGPHRLQPRP